MTAYIEWGIVWFDDYPNLQNWFQDNISCPFGDREGCYWMVLE